MYAFEHYLSTVREKERSETVHESASLQQLLFSCMTTKQVLPRILIQSPNQTPSTKPQVVFVFKIDVWKRNGSFCQQQNHVHFPSFPDQSEFTFQTCFNYKRNRNSNIIATALVSQGLQPGGLCFWRDSDVNVSVVTFLSLGFRRGYHLRCWTSVLRNNTFLQKV